MPAPSAPHRSLKATAGGGVTPITLKQFVPGTAPCWGTVGWGGQPFGRGHRAHDQQTSLFTPFTGPQIPLPSLPQRGQAARVAQGILCSKETYFWSRRYIFKMQIRGTKRRQRKVSPPPSQEAAMLSESMYIYVCLEP